jgi:hypothetical protein
MKFIKSFSALCLVALIILLVGSCKKSQSSGWNTQLLIPIATTNLSLQNLITDSTLKTNADSSLTLAYQSTLYSFNLADEIVQIPDTSIGQKFNLDSLTLPNLHLNFITSLGDICQGLGGFGNLIIGSNLDSSTIGPLSVPTAFTYGFNASNLFDSAVLVSGQAQVWAINHLPVTIAAGSVCTVSDTIDGQVHVLQTVVFDSIPANDSIYVPIPLIPQKISSRLAFNVGHINTEASHGKILIDTSNNIQLRVAVGGMHVSEAWAKFPNQSIVNQTNDITFNFNDRKFTYIEARSGFLHISISNSVPQPLYLQYTLVGAFNKLGQPLTEYTTVSAAGPLGPGVVDTLLDITGYSINLTGKNGNNFNTYTQQVITNLDSTGQTQHITLADSLNVKYELENIKPNYIKGYLGKDTVTNVDSSAFSFLSIFKSGSLNLQSVNMNFSVSNDIGEGGQIKINSLSAYSPVNGTKTLSSTLLNQPLNIKPATDFPLTPAVTTYSLNNSNSNIKDLIGILPNQLNYNISVRTNVNGNNNQYREFAYLQSGLTVSLDAKIPLSLIANNLVLMDTIGFNLANTNTNINGISDGVINVIAENGYPIGAVLTVIVYDGNWNPLDTLAFDKTITAGATDVNCKVNQPAQSVLQEYVDEARMNKLKQGQHAVVTANFSTVGGNPACNGQHLKIYSNYTIGITLSAKFNYKVNTKL